MNDIKRLYEAGDLDELQRELTRRGYGSHVADDRIIGCSQPDPRWLDVLGANREAIGLMRVVWSTAVKDVMSRLTIDLTTPSGFRWIDGSTSRHVSIACSECGDRGAVLTLYGNKWICAACDPGVQIS